MGIKVWRAGSNKKPPFLPPSLPPSVPSSIKHAGSTKTSVTILLLKSFLFNQGWKEQALVRIAGAQWDVIKGVSLSPGELKFFRLWTAEGSVCWRDVVCVKARGTYELGVLQNGWSRGRTEEMGLKAQAKGRLKIACYAILEEFELYLI